MEAFLQLFAPFRSRPRVEADTPAPDRQPRIGIALSSGGAKGLAHIGVIQVLEEHGIEIEAIAGTSMGAYVGGLWASGLNGKELEALAAAMASKRDLWQLVDPVFPPRRGFIKGHKILKRLRASLGGKGGKTFAQLEKPFLAVATDLDSLERTAFQEGDVASAILASLAVPGIVVPVTRDGVEYIDGGVSDSLPVTLARETWDLDYVIGVNVLPPIGSLRKPAVTCTSSSPWCRSLHTINRHLNYFADGNLLDILRSAAIGSQMRLVEKSSQMADVLISPMSPKTGWHDYHRYAEYIEIGREAAQKALPAIIALTEPNADPCSPEASTLNRLFPSCAIN